MFLLFGKESVHYFKRIYNKKSTLVVEVMVKKEVVVEELVEEVVEGRVRPPPSDPGGGPEGQWQLGGSSSTLAAE